MLSLQNTRYFSVARKKHIEQNATSPGSFSTINTPINYLRPVSKERNVRTNVVGIFMSTSTGNTDQAAECIRKHLVSHITNHANLIHPTSTTCAEIDATSFSQISQNVETSVVFDVGDVQVKDMKAYTGLVVGAPTWNTGSDTMRSGTCWDDVLEDIRALDLKDKKVAVFGLGDSSHFSENFCDAIEEIHDTFATTGAEMIGYVAVKGTNEIHRYTFDHSEAVRDDKFLGLPLDEDNEFDYTEGRVKGWTKQLIDEGLE